MLWLLYWFLGLVLGLCIGIAVAIYKTNKLSKNHNLNLERIENFHDAHIDGYKVTNQKQRDMLLQVIEERDKYRDKLICLRKGGKEAKKKNKNDDVQIITTGGAPCFDGDFSPIAATIQPVDKNDDDEDDPAYD